MSSTTTTKPKTGKSENTKQNPDLTSSKNKPKLRREGTINIRSLDTKFQTSDNKFLKSRYSSALAKWGVRNKGGNWDIGGLTPEEFKEEFGYYGTEFTVTDAGGTVRWNNQALENYFVTVPDTGMTLDLSRSDERLTYYVLLGWKDKSFSESNVRTNSSQLYYFYDESEEAAKKNKKASQRVEADLFVRELDSSLLSDYCILFGYDIDGKSEDVLRANLYEVAEQKPNEILKINSQDELTKAQIVVKKAVRKGMFKREGSGIYYEELFLGSTEADAARNMLKEKNEKLLAKTISAVNVE